MARYISKVVNVGKVKIGGLNPIRIQSMTNTNTLDIQATVDQVIKLVNAGCEIVRITAPGVREAKSLTAIKNMLNDKGYDVPLVADIHFNPKAAEISAAIVEKVRINPGNYTGSLSASKFDYTDKEYEEELITITNKLKPLVNICQTHGTAIRVGVNQGSLGGRILQRYGDTVKGMVISALEYARIFNDLGFENLIISVKSSNTRVMVEAYRELAKLLYEENLNYPLHLGVTEAGDGDEGRMKSLVGIGAVLAHGIGDTIRVSLTEEPVKEIPVAKSIVQRFNTKIIAGVGIRDYDSEVLLDNVTRMKSIADNEAHGFPEFKSPTALIIKKGDQLFLGNEDGSLSALPHQILTLTDLNQFNESIPQTILIDENPVDESFDNITSSLSKFTRVPIILKLSASHAYQFITKLRLSNLKNPVILINRKDSNGINETLVENSLYPGSLLVEGLAQGLCIEQGSFPIDKLMALGFGILQASRARITRTEFISCPSCGRTQFNLIDRLQEVKAATSHLKGLKIAVMGCVVNGPGEMADADYGYVGAGNGKVTLYKNKTLVKHSIPESESVNALVELIKENGDWKPSSEQFT